jgi:hypothetical protein
MFSDLLMAGSYGIGERDGRKQPRFVFAVRDLSEVRPLLAGMYVRLFVGRNDDGLLAYTLDIPDRGTDTWEIVPEPEDVAALEEAARDTDCVTVIKGAGSDHIDLAPFVAGVRHDWSGRFSDALRAFFEGRVDQSREVLQAISRERPNWPQARHWIGRCHRERGSLEAAASSYRAALGLFNIRGQKTFPPLAAGILSDLGVVRKKTGDLDGAAVCLKWSLALRPNHPEALATAASLLAGNEAVFMDALTRIIAIGGRDDIAERLTDVYAESMGRDRNAVLSKARSAAEGFDLERGLPLVDPPLTPERFFAELGGGAPRQPPPSAKKPWWRPW